MKTPQPAFRRTLIAAVLVALAAIHASAQTFWIGSAGDNDWNNALNWDLGVPAEGTNAIVGPGNVVNYNAPMTAPGFGMLELSSAQLNVNAAGFVVDGLDAAIRLTSTTTGNNFPTNGLYVGNGGVVSVPNGNLVLTNNSVVSLATGGSLTINGTLQIGGVSGNNDLRVCVTNTGGVLSALATTLNPNNAAGANQANLGAALYILGGTNDLGNVTIRRAPAAGTQSNDALGRQGVVVSNGLVRTASLDVGGPNGNSWLSMLVAGGTVTNSGDFTVRTTGTANRGSRYFQVGGLFVSTGPSVRLRGQTAQNGLVTYSITGGTNLVNGFVLADATDTIGTVNFTNAAKIYLGSGGMTMEGSLTATNVILNNGGIFGATENWSGTVPITLNGGTIETADLNGAARDITLAGGLRGSGALIKTGGGKLTLDAPSSYSGNTLVNAGTLALGATGDVASSPQIIVASGATLDVSAVVGFTLGSSRTLGGEGTVVGDVAVAGGAIINPGSVAGTLTLANSLTQTGDAINHFDLPAAPGSGNDLLIVNGDLNISGLNTIEIVGGGAPGSVHTLIQYGGNFSGSLANFALSGANGVLSNNPTTKTITLIVQSSVRSPTEVVWLGNPSVNDWDTVNRTNWLNVGTGLLDFFVAGDNALFDNRGAANPNVNLIGNNAPGSLTVGASANYLLGGNGVISGTTGLTKTNTGTLTITNLNSYSGVTLFGGGVVEAATLANGGNPSSIGAASSDAANLVFDGGALRYTGASVGIDRGATFNSGGGIIDVADADATLTGGGALGGAGGFTKSGAGTLVLPNANAYAGGTVVSNGTLRVNVPGAAGGGAVTLAGGTLLLGMATDNDLANPIAVNAPSSLVMAGSNNRVNGAVSGDQLLNLTVNSGLVLTFNGNLTNYSGTFALGSSAGTFRLNSGGGNATFGFPNATIDLGDGTAALQARNPGTMAVGALRGGVGTFVRGPGSADGTVTWEIGSSTNEPSTTFDGTITDATATRLAAVHKIGPGTLRLTGNNSYSGATIVSEGTLQVDGSLGVTTVSVAGGTLSGIGAIAGAVDVQFGGALSPGASIGTLTVSSLTLQSGSTTVMEINKPASTNDNIIGLASVFFGGTLVISNESGALAAGDSFKLFDAVPGSYAGAFEAILPESPGNGLRWDTSDLTVDGTLKVTSSGARIDSLAFDGHSLTVSGSGGVALAEYQVLVSTNVAAALSAWSTNATHQFDGAGNFSFITPVDPALPRLFYLIQFQTP